MRLRQATVEHPFDTLEHRMGLTFLTKTIENVSAEMSLHVLAYDIKQVLNLIGIKKLMEVI